MEIKDYKTGDEQAILELFKLVYNREMPLDHWHWRFSDNPAGKHFIKLMWDADKLIGHYAVSPVWMNVNGKRILTSQSLTTMTHPEYGRRGIFKTLALELYYELEQEKGVKLIWGFPNNNSHYGFIKNLGWANTGLLHTMATNSNFFEKILSEKVKEISEFSSVHQQLLSFEGNSQSVRLEKSKDYLNWRYVDKPSVNYRIFELENSKGVLVSKIYPTTQEGKWDINIVELALEDWSNLGLLINHLLSSYTESIDRITIWKNLMDPNYIALERNGFTPSTPLTYLGIRAKNEILKLTSDLRNWDISLGDSDVY